MALILAIAEVSCAGMVDFVSFGMVNAAMIRIMVTTISSSMRVNPRSRLRLRITGNLSQPPWSVHTCPASVNGVALHRRAPSGAGTRHSAFPPTPRLSWSQRVALDFFLGGFLASRFGAFLFPMPTASHRFEDDARGQTLKLRHNLHFFHIQNL